MTDEGLKYLTKLRALKSLDLSETEVTDEGLKYLAKLKTLKSLDLNKTEVTEEGVTALEQALPSCKIDFEEEIPEHLIPREAEPPEGEDTE